MSTSTQGGYNSIIEVFGHVEKSVKAQGRVRKAGSSSKMGR